MRALTVIALDVKVENEGAGCLLVLVLLGLGLKVTHSRIMCLNKAAACPFISPGAKPGVSVLLCEFLEFSCGISLVPHIFPGVWWFAAMSLSPLT